MEEVCQIHQQMIAGDMNVQIAFLDPHMKIDAFALHAKTTVDCFQENNPDQSNTLLQVLIEDNQTSTFPFFVVLLLFRAGCHNEALQFCETSQSEEVRAFGQQIYKVYCKDFNCSIPRNELAGFLAHARRIKSNQPDVCREALVHLMAGCDFRSQQNANVLFNVLFQNSVDHWLWFNLKLASVDLDSSSADQFKYSNGENG